MTENPSMNAKEEARRPDCVTEVRMGKDVYKRQVQHTAA